MQIHGAPEALRKMLPLMFSREQGSVLQIHIEPAKTVHESTAWTMLSAVMCKTL